MPAERTPMRQVREVLRLKFVGGVPLREIARRIGVAASTVRETINRFRAAGLSWPLPEEITDAALEARLYAMPAASRVTAVRSSRIGPASIASSSASTSPCRFSGTNTSSAIPRAIAIRGSASCTEAGKVSFR
jgi:transposase-like protein